MHLEKAAVNVLRYKEKNDVHRAAIYVALYTDFGSGVRAKELRKESKPLPTPSLHKIIVNINELSSHRLHFSLNTEELQPRNSN